MGSNKVKLCVSVEYQASTIIEIPFDAVDPL
jgi:hypothetical protein